MLLKRSQYGARAKIPLPSWNLPKSQETSWASVSPSLQWSPYACLDKALGRIHCQALETRYRSGCSPSRLSHNGILPIPSG
jgi:hypothetical protein